MSLIQARGVLPLGLWLQACLINFDAQCSVFSVTVFIDGERSANTGECSATDVRVSAVEERITT